ncbi:hypothetical protein B296_00057824 [Ensete ventricosum]|uniref:Uncharacterized protein n=1 Tax=Ensete ventricosum TaxID=4639 RepID=A0A426WXJ5_ENSVE|nr:hypothetical protein B296_00057824 [Ensete ventricosum]
MITSTRVKHLVALCAAPDGWSWCGSRLIFAALHLVISVKCTIICTSKVFLDWRDILLTFSPRCGDLPLTVAIGLHPVDLIDGVNQVQGDDITNVRTAEVVKIILLLYLVLLNS